MTVTGRPRRRARLAALEAALSDEALPPLPPDATPEQQHERARVMLSAIRRANREQKIRAGRVTPRTYAEAEIFASDLKDRRTPNAEQVQADPE
jgi:hypothetical protein